MKSYKHFWLLFIPFLWGCKTRYRPTDNSYSQYKIQSSSSSSSDSINEIEAFLKPFRDSLSKEMNVVIGEAGADFYKDKGSLGKLVVEAMEEKSKSLSKKELTGVITNSGGLRIQQLPKGPITTGKIFELLPFENELVLVEVPGSVLEKWMNFIESKGGWPTSYLIPYRKKSGVLLEDTLRKIMGSLPASADKSKFASALKHLQTKSDSIYYIATNDYLANGGDNCDFLKSCKKIETGILLRTLMMDYIKEQKVVNPILSFFEIYFLPNSRIDSSNFIKTKN